MHHSVEPKTSRRTWLRMLASAVMVGGGLRYLSAADSFHARKAALAKAAEIPGPARDKLLALRMRHPAVPLPFDLDCIPGFSRPAHEVHFSHHYLEYLWRWENGERELLKLAAELSRLARAATDQFETRREALLATAEDVRQSANMVLLHNSYWSAFSAGDPARTADVRVLANQLPGQVQSDKLTWLVLLGPVRRLAGYSSTFKVQDADGGIDGTGPFNAEGLHRIESMNSSVPFSYAAFAAIDCLDHSWLLDFYSFEKYLAQVLLNCSPAAWHRWKFLLDVALPDSEANARQLRPVMRPARHIGSSEQQVQQRNGSLAAAATERPVAEQMSGPEARVRARIATIAGELELSHLEPTAVLEGLRLAAGPNGHVAIACPFLYDTQEVMIITPNSASGLLDSVLVSGVPGLALPGIEAAAS